MEQQHRFIDVESDSVESAIEKGIKKLNLSIEKIDIKILEEPKSSFIPFASKKAKVRLFVLDNNYVMPGEEKKEKPKRVEKPAVKPVIEERREVKERPERTERQSVSIEQKNVSAVDPNEEILADDGKSEIIKEKFTKLIGSMGFSATPQVAVLKNKYRIIIKDTPDANLLIGKNGKTIEALQHITNKILSKDHVERPIYLDIKGYVKQKRKNKMERRWKKEGQSPRR